MLLYSILCYLYSIQRKKCYSNLYLFQQRANVNGGPMVRFAIGSESFPGVCCKRTLQIQCEISVIDGLTLQIWFSSIYCRCYRLRQRWSRCFHMLGDQFSIVLVMPESLTERWERAPDEALLTTAATMARGITATLHRIDTLGVGWK